MPFSSKSKAKIGRKQSRKVRKLGFVWWRNHGGNGRIYTSVERGDFGVEEEGDVKVTALFVVILFHPGHRLSWVVVMFFRRRRKSKNGRLLSLAYGFVRLTYDFSFVGSRLSSPAGLNIELTPCDSRSRHRCRRPPLFFRLMMFLAMGFLADPLSLVLGLCGTGEGDLEEF